MEQKKNIRALLALLSIYIVWGTTYLAIRIGVKDLPPVLFSGLRWFIAGPIMLAVLLLRKYKLPSKNDILHLGISGLLLLGGGNVLVVFAEQWIPSGLTALLITTVPFWAVGIEAVIPNGKKLNVFIIIGLMLGLLGVIMIFGGNFHQLFEPAYIKGVIGILLAEICWAGGTVYSKYKKVSVHPLMGAATQMIIAGGIITLVGLVIGETAQFKFTHDSFFAFLYLIVFGSFVGYGSYIYAISHLPVSLVATYAYVNPIIALFLGWLVLGEPITIWIVIASVVILAGVTMVKKGSERQTAAHRKI